MSLSMKSVLCVALAVASIGIVSVQCGSINVDFGLYVAKWAVQQNNITVEITAEGIGYIGFGISPSKGMTGADIFIAGVDPEGKLYHYDTHGTGNTAPVIDDVDNYELLSASENATHTTIRFQRRLDTGDSQDLNITNSEQNILWAIGGNDDLEWHFRNRGVLEINLLNDTAVHHITYQGTQ